MSAETYICTCSGAHAPGGQAVRRCEAVEHANILRRQELHKLGVLEHISFAVEDGGSLVRNVDYPSCVQRHGYCKDVLLRQKFKRRTDEEVVRQYMQLKRWTYSNCLKDNSVTHVVFEGVFRSDAVYLFYRIRGYIQA